jgi:hypothetical protein
VVESQQGLAQLSERQIAPFTGSLPQTFWSPLALRSAWLTLLPKQLPEVFTGKQSEPPVDGLSITRSVVANGVKKT